MHRLGLTQKFIFDTNFTNYKGKLVQLVSNPFNAVMHSSSVEFHAVNALGSKIILTGLPAAKSYVRIYGVNPAGKGKPSVPYLFTPQ